MSSGLFILKSHKEDKFFSSETNGEIMHKVIQNSFNESKNPFNSESVLLSNFIEEMFSNDFFWILPSSSINNHDITIVVDFKNKTITTNLGTTGFYTFQRNI